MVLLGARNNRISFQAVWLKGTQMSKMRGGKKLEKLLSGASTGKRSWN
jgi:hypothetical protein